MATVKKGLIVLVTALVVWGGLKVSGQTDAPPRRIVSVVPSLTEMLYAIGAGPQVVGVSSYDEFPPEATRLPRVGALLDPDVERILALRPDLVLAYGSQTTLEAQMARSGIKVFSYRHGGVDGILQGLRALGVATGHAAGGERTARELRERLDAVKARVRTYSRPRVLLVFGRQPQSLQQMYASGGTGVLDDLLEIAGAVNVFADVPRESVQPSRETVLTRAPEVIVEVRARNPPTTAQMAAERRAWAPLASIPAVRNNNIHFLTADYYFVPGPRVAMAAEGLARTLHPEAFR